jgi:hypothetical protein
MDPFLAHTLLGTSRHDSTRSSLRNPDNLFPEREMMPPDPVATWAVSAATTSEEWLRYGAARGRYTWRQMLTGWAVMLRRLARGTR